MAKPNRQARLIIAAISIMITFAVNASAQNLSVQDGKATFYAARMHGQRMASGERYDKDAMICAHRTLPFGTLLRVTNKNNGLSVIVRVADRGPFIHGRVVDLSTAAARKIDMIRAGIAPVHLEVVSEEPSDTIPQQDVTTEETP